LEIDPTWPDWITALAVVVATVAAVFAGPVFWRDQKDRREAQARQIAAWVEWHDPDGNAVLYQDSATAAVMDDPSVEHPGRHVCVLLNTSPLSIRELLLEYRFYEVGGHPEGDASEYVRDLPPGRHVLHLPHPFGPGRVVVGWHPCLCVEGHSGHRTYWCRTCRTTLHVPPHAP
jgi:hypothetical protein